MEEKTAQRIYWGVIALLVLDAALLAWRPDGVRYTIEWAFRSIGTIIRLPALTTLGHWMVRALPALFIIAAVLVWRKIRYAAGIASASLALGALLNIIMALHFILLPLLFGSAGAVQALIAALSVIAIITHIVAGVLIIKERTVLIVPAQGIQVK